MIKVNQKKALELLLKIRINEFKDVVAGAKKIHGL